MRKTKSIGWQSGSGFRVANPYSGRNLAAVGRNAMYKAPVEEIAFTLRHVAGLGDVLGAGPFSDLSDDLVEAILDEAGRFATEEIAPIAEIGDKQGAKLVDGAVK